MNTATAFNPDAYVRRDAPAAPAVRDDSRPIAARTAKPFDWQRGLSRLAEMPIPRGATDWRWRQIVADAMTFADVWHLVAVEFGWSLGHLFGFDLDQADGHVGLVVDIRGGAVTYLDPDRARITLQNGSRITRAKNMPADSAPIWTLRTIVQ